MADAIEETGNQRPIRLAKQKAFVEIHNIFHSKKQSKRKPKRLESILESVSVSDGNNNNNEPLVRNISNIFNELNINDNKSSTSDRPNESNNTNGQRSLIDQNLDGNLDDSVILVEPDVQVIELLEDSFDDNSHTMHFSMLSTDDPTDEEDEDLNSVHSNAAWSCRTNVKTVVLQQEYIQQNIVDTLFGCNAMTVDLYDIFPDIEPELTVRRRSSVHWNTPPRYSMLPKY